MAKQTEMMALRAQAWSELATVLRLRREADAARQGEALKICEAKGDRVSAQHLRRAPAALNA